jgi:GATA-binding protein
MYGNHGTQSQSYDGNGLIDPQFHQSPSLAPHHLRQPSPGRSESSMNLDVAQTYEQLIAANASLKTRVSELEVINELFRGRVTQLEQDEQNARRGEEMRRISENALRQNLEESQRRENQLKRRLDDQELELNELREAAGPRAKKMRLDNTENSESSTPQSST